MPVSPFATAVIADADTGVQDSLTITVKGSNQAATDGNDTVSLGGSNDIVTLGNGTNTVSGTQGIAFITTGAGNDTIRVGGSGNSISAGGGSNAIFGGAGNDSFVLPAAGAGYDSITSFSESNGDFMGLRAALLATTWNHLTGTLGNYLKVTAAGGNPTLSIAQNGSGAGTAVAVLNGAGTLALADLLSHHSLLVV